MKTIATKTLTLLLTLIALQGCQDNASTAKANSAASNPYDYDNALCLTTKYFTGEQYYTKKCFQGAGEPVNSCEKIRVIDDGLYYKPECFPGAQLNPPPSENPIEQNNGNDNTDQPDTGTGNITRSDCIRPDYCYKDYALTFNDQLARLKKQINWTDEQTGLGVNILLPDGSFDIDHPFWTNTTIMQRDNFFTEQELQKTDSNLPGMPIEGMYLAPELTLTMQNTMLAFKPKEENNISYISTCMTYYDPQTDTYNYPADLKGKPSSPAESIARAGYFYGTKYYADTLDKCIERDIKLRLDIYDYYVRYNYKNHLKPYTENPARPEFTWETNDRTFKLKHGQLTATALKSLAPDSNIIARHISYYLDSIFDPRAQIISFSMAQPPRSISGVTTPTCNLPTANTLQAYIIKHWQALKLRYPDRIAELIALRMDENQTDLKPYTAWKMMLKQDALFVQAAGNESKIGKKQETFEIENIRQMYCADELKTNLIIVGAIDQENISEFYSNIPGDLMKDSFIVAPARPYILDQINQDTSEQEQVVPYRSGQNYKYPEGGGTSFATPIVAAAAAQVKQRYPTLKASEIKQILLRSATDLGEPGVDRIFGHGLLNVKAALALADRYMTTGSYE